MRLVVLSTLKKNAINMLTSVGPELGAQNIDWSVATDHSLLGELPDMVFLLGYDKIVDADTLARLNGRMAVFHSSDLPKGRGWAPIYTTLASQNPVHTITLCYLENPVDSGNILLKAHVPVPCHYTAGMLRQVGQRVIAQIIVRYTKRFEGELPPGLVQDGFATYVRRRGPEDAFMEAGQPLEALMPHILASEPPNSAYIQYRGERFRILAIPEREELHSSFTVEEYFSSVIDRTITLSL